MRTGREAADLRTFEEGVLSEAAVDLEADGGWLMGWLETIRATLGLSCAAAEDDTKPIKTNAQTDRYEIFFKLFKT